MTHDWILEDMVGDTRKPILVKATCGTCKCKLTMVCGITLYDPSGTALSQGPDGPASEMEPPCKPIEDGRSANRLPIESR